MDPIELKEDQITISENIEMKYSINALHLDETLTDDNVRVRSGPSTDDSILGKVNKGDVVQVAYKEGEWYHTYWGAHGGWIHSDYLKGTSTPTGGSPETGESSGTEESSADLSVGSKGDAVSKLQNKLRWLGYLSSNDAVDGKFGSDTKQAVMDLQSDYGISETGIVDQKTKGALTKALYEAKITDSMLITGSTYTYLKYGDTGDAVKQLQSDLTFLNYKPGCIDGEFGSNTESAVKAFQKNYGLEITGVADVKTRKAIENAIDSVIEGNANPDYGSGGDEITTPISINVSSTLQALPGTWAAGKLLQALKDNGIADIDGLLSKSVNTLINQLGLQDIKKEDIGNFLLGIMMSVDDNILLGASQTVAGWFGSAPPEDNHYYMIGKVMADGMFLTSFLTAAGAAAADAGRALATAAGAGTLGLLTSETGIGFAVFETAAGIELI